MNAASESSAVKTISATLYDFGNKHRSNIKNRVRRIYPKCQISMGGNSCEVEAEHHSIIFGSSECKCDLPVCEFGDRFQRVQTFLTVEWKSHCQRGVPGAGKIKLRPIFIISWDWNSFHRILIGVWVGPAQLVPSLLNMMFKILLNISLGTRSVADDFFEKREIKVQQLHLAVRLSLNGKFRQLRFANVAGVIRICIFWGTCNFETVCRCSTG